MGAARPAFDHSMVVEFADCYPRRVIAQIDGVAVPVIDLADLRTNKKAAGRYKDLDDLENLPEPDSRN